MGCGFFHGSSFGGLSMLDTLKEQAVRNLTSVRDQKPLVHSITNFVVMNFTANTLLAMGASPVMAHAEEEVEEMVSLAGALVLNIGTLSGPWIASMLKAGRKAAELHKPVILDPVGAGATELRTRTALEIMEAAKPSVIRGNASEILALARTGSKTKGVDSLHTVEDLGDRVEEMALNRHAVFAVTGPRDLVTDGVRTVKVGNGHPLMSTITGTGCAATVTIGAFLAVDPDPWSAAATALAFFGLAGEIGASSCHGPGSFMTAFLDALYNLTPEALAAGCRFEQP
ncbi:hydoxyethylthiazole kinase [uncultured Desulfatiglans sp.]|nr:hydoxyethylthiazole kinase [uncultured Desulfatiglans sp.]